MLTTTLVIPWGIHGYLPLTKPFFHCWTSHPHGWSYDDHPQDAQLGIVQQHPFYKPDSVLPVVTKHYSNGRRPPGPPNFHHRSHGVSCPAQPPHLCVAGAGLFDSPGRLRASGLLPGPRYVSTGGIFGEDRGFQWRLVTRRWLSFTNGLKQSCNVAPPSCKLVYKPQ